MPAFILPALVVVGFVVQLFDFSGFPRTFGLNGTSSFQLATYWLFHGDGLHLAENLAILSTAGVVVCRRLWIVGYVFLVVSSCVLPALLYLSLSQDLAVGSSLISFALLGGSLAIGPRARILEEPVPFEIWHLFLVIMILEVGRSLVTGSWFIFFIHACSLGYGSAFIHLSPKAPGYRSNGGMY